MSAATAFRYETIGRQYASTRQEDPRLMAEIIEALGDAETIVNVGAGTGSYEPTDRHVIAVEPSDVMVAQRPAGAAPAIRASAGRLPLRDNAVDAALAVLTVHHWDAEQAAGVCELRRVARGPVVIVTFDATVSGAMWLMADYLPEVAALDRRIFPSVATLAGWLGGQVDVTPWPIPHDTPDWTLGSFWAHPERVLDATARASTSGFARMPSAIVDRTVWEITRDLHFGVWDARHGELRTRDSYEVGQRLVIAR